jgi:hypothetical protein
MITFDTARALAAHLAASRRALIVDPDDARPWLATLEGALSLIPGAAPVLTTVRGLVSGAAESVAGLAVPSPWGTAILLTPRALVDPAAYVATVTHELVHASQVVALGAGQATVDYLSPELRALREAEAGGVGLWVRYLVTGVRPSPDDAGAVSSPLYHLGASERAFGRAVVEGVLSAIDTGAVPPHSVARAVLAWLREHAPAAIVAPECADRDTAVPS